MHALRETGPDAAPFEMELRFLRGSDEAYRWFLLRGSPVRGVDGKVLKWLVAATDIHAQKESRAWSDAMIDALPNPLWLLEPETGQILYKSRAASEMENYEIPNGVTPEQWRKLYPLTDSDGTPLPVEEYPAFRAARGDLSRREAVWQSPKGPIVFLSQAAMIPACFGRPATVAFMIQDVNALKAVERELRSAVAALDQFLSIASHELKTPLTSLRLLTQSARRRMSTDVRKTLSPERLATFVEQTDRSVDRLARLVDDMLDVARIASGKLTFQFEPVALELLLDDVLERFRPEADSTGVSVTIVQRSSVHGHWDQLRLEQVLTNLLTNALRYGKGTPIEVTLRREGDDAIVEVTDRGPGVPEAYRETIFQRFERLPSEEAKPGLGLGLFICREIVEHHGGRIHVEPVHGIGAKFVVRLPRAPKDDRISAAPRIAAESPAPSSATSEARP